MKAASYATTLIAVLATLILVCSASAPAATRIVPSIDEVIGDYVISDSWSEYDFSGPPDGGKTKDVFVITKTDVDKLHLVWYGEEGGSWTYDGYYRNGVFFMGMGNTGAAPSTYMESMFIVFSGTPGKLKIRGRYCYYELGVGYTDIENYTGKQTR